MKLTIYFIFIFLAMLKSADAAQGISAFSRDTIYKIIIKSEDTIQDHKTNATYSDIIAEYEALCDYELQRAKDPTVITDITNVCELTLEILASLKTPEAIADYEAHIRDKANAKYEPVPHPVCNDLDSKLCTAANSAAQMANFSLKVIFYPFKALFTGDFGFN